LVASLDFNNETEVSNFLQGIVEKKSTGSKHIIKNGIVLSLFLIFFRLLIRKTTVRFSFIFPKRKPPKKEQGTKIRSTLQLISQRCVERIFASDKTTLLRHFLFGCKNRAISFRRGTVFDQKEMSQNAVLSDSFLALDYFIASLPNAQTRVRKKHL
jgi:hypothetical protein